MIAKETRLGTDPYEVKTWELNLLLIEVILLAALALAWVWASGTRLLGAGSPWADAGCKGLGFFLLGLALYPAIRVQSRNARGYELRFSRWIIGDLIGSAVGTLVYLLLR